MKKIFVYCVCSLLTLSVNAAVKQVGAGNDLRRVIRTMSDGDTLLLTAGRYTIEGTLPLNRSLVIVGEAGSRPEVVLPSFVAGTGARYLALKNLAVTLSGRTLVGTLPEGEVDIDLIALEGCSVNLGGEQGGSVVNSRSANAAKNRIGEIRVTDSYRTGGPDPLPGAHGLKTFASSVDELFEHPSDDPLREGTSFGIREQSLSGLRIGDPRWIK